MWTGKLPGYPSPRRAAGRIGGTLSGDEGRGATYLATLNTLARLKKHLGSLNRVMRVIRLWVSLVTTADFEEHPMVPMLRPSCWPASLGWSRVLLVHSAE